MEMRSGWPAAKRLQTSSFRPLPAAVVGDSHSASRGTIFSASFTSAGNPRTMISNAFIDAEIFREYLIAVGLEIPPQTTPVEACELAVRGLDDQRARELRHLVEQ